jgi:histidine triad (HIT) family protein
VVRNAITVLRRRGCRAGWRAAPASTLGIVASDCLFCKIVAGDIPADVVEAGELVVAFRDLDPRAPTHVLVIPRDHHENVAKLAAADPAALAELVAVGAAVADAEQDGEFRLVFNTGPTAGQSVFHVHGHVLAGRKLTWPPG